MKLPKYNQEGSAVGEIEVNEAIFNVDVNKGLIYEMIKAEEANKRQGNAATKSRGFVSGGGAKPWRQKGTGRARQGSTRSTQWVGGGIPHGPEPRSYKTKLPQKMRQRGFISILSHKANSSSIRVLDSLSVAEPKTKIVSQMLKKMEANARVCILHDSEDLNLKLAARNIKAASLVSVERLSARELFYNHMIIATEGAIKKLEEKFAV